MVQDLWQAHYQIFLIIFLKEFIELNGSRYDHKKNVKLVKLHEKYVTVSGIHKR